MNNKIYIIATAENKHLIIPYLESLGGVNLAEWNVNDMHGRGHWLILPNGNICAEVKPIPGYTEMHLKEQDGVICA
jgi:hypothetical protein